MTTAARQTTHSPAHEIDLAIEGMTCASCSSRVERRLNKIEGVEAVVNLVTEKAHIRFSDPVNLADLMAAVTKAGYAASPLGDAAPPAARPTVVPEPAGDASAGAEAESAPQEPPTATAPEAPATVATAATGDTGEDEATYATADAPSGASSPSELAEVAASAESPQTRTGRDSDEDAATTAALPASPPGAASARTSTEAAPAADAIQAPVDRTSASTTASTWARFIGRLRKQWAAADLRTRLVVAAVLTVPLVLIAMTPFGHGLGAARPWVELLLAAPVATWAAWPFHRVAARTARHRAATMDTLVSLGVIASFGWSLVATVSGFSGHLYYETAAVITTFLLAGRVAEARARREGRGALESLLELSRGDVTVLRTDRTGARVQERIDVAELGVGTLFLVRPGEKVATDGVVEEGVSAVDASLVTGESMPVDVAAGDRVIGGSVNTTGLLVVRTTAVGSDTMLAGITRLVEDAQTGKAPVQRLADRVSAVFVPIVLALAAVTLIGWLVTGHAAADALSAAVAVLVVACPCALGLATPTALLVGTGRGAQLGVLIKGPEILESTRRVDLVLLDKTGTVTTGSMRLVDIAPTGRLTATAALRAAAAVEFGSEHPVAAAIVAAAAERGLNIPQATDTQALPGSGVQARIKDTLVTVGRADLFERMPDDIGRLNPAGTTVYVGWGGMARAALTVADGVRPDSADGVRQLHDLGLTTYLVTGDNLTTARGVAQEVGIAIDRVIAGVRPADKHAVVERLQREGHVVAMVGDGVNDAAALAAADLGIAMGQGTDIARESADIVLMRPQLAAVADAIALSRRTLRICQENLGWAFAYNIIALPLAVVGVVDPMFAGAAMASSSVIVVLNSLRLRSFAAGGSRRRSTSGSHLSPSD